MKITDICWSRSWSRSGAGFKSFAGAGAGVEPGKKIYRLCNLETHKYDKDEATET